jgi:hypothetical protein
LHVIQFRADRVKRELAISLRGVYFSYVD